MEILIDAGAEMGARNDKGFRALYLAVDGRHLESVELLLSRGSEVNMKVKGGSTPLHLAAELEWTDGLEVLLKQTDVEVNARSDDGQTPLHRACCNGHTHTVGLLLGHNGIDANVVNIFGDTPLHEAVRGRRYKVVSVMLNQDSVKFHMEGKHKMTPFLQAVEWGHLGIIKKLLDKGAKVNAVNNEGNNCLHLALQNDVFHSEEEHIALLDKYAFKLSLTQGNRTCSTVVATYLFHFGANFYHPNGKNVIPLDLIQDTNLKEELKTFLPPPCTYCRVRASAEFKPCGHTVLCRECYGKIKCESCSTCQRPIRGLDGFEAPKFEDRCVKTEATCQELGAASQAIDSKTKSEDKCVQTEVASQEIGEYKITVAN
ncbi:ankyrin-1-like [Octopus sinensis]|uniref:Ankyrin-1-like n=1 Tax=Octopus sinensis TaxID=2607531 RepID=A0A7E6EJK0_9MOLL|nr:ankyrin-1-like [Octopus sinensis]